MGRPTTGALYAVAMAAVVVGVDILVFRNHFWERLAANVGIVLVFGAFPASPIAESATVRP
jgi:hypothetical protein